MIKYNKKIKEILNININDYKKYSELYSSIEIELIPVDNRYGQFININNEDKKFYHIYKYKFNNFEEEIKRDHIKFNEYVRKIKIVVDYQVKSFKELFYNCICLEKINFKKFYRNNITNMDCMFYGCSSLKELNITNFNTSNVINMNFMFRGCSSLKQLNLSNFNTSNVTEMKFIFCECKSLETLNLSILILVM